MSPMVIIGNLYYSNFPGSLDEFKLFKDWERDFWLDSGEGGAREKMFEMLDTLWKVCIIFSSKISCSIKKESLGKLDSQG